MPAPTERTSIKVQAERAILAAVHLPDSNHDPADPFGELRLLAEQAGAVIVGEMIQARQRPEPATFMGSGKVEELKALCESLEASTVIFDHDLSPKQIANIEDGTGRKVIDRSELILDIFAARATTHEAKLQTELAQLEYTYPRLRAMWDHLERQVSSGGAGGSTSRGPGEQQLEIDRRLVQRRKLDLQDELRTIQARKRREVRQRKQDHFTVGLVGYTNAGKSTLFNSLTAGGAYADDRLFATLVSRTREWDLGSGLTVMLSDTVGFVRDLPHNLIASFRATLEEATHADVLLIVLDVADPAAELHYQTVNETLEALFEKVARFEAKEGEEWSPPDRILLLNKADRLRDNSELLVWQQKVPGSIPFCALPEATLGRAELNAAVREAAQGGIDNLRITLPMADARTIHRLENLGEVSNREYTDSSVTLEIRIGRRQIDQLKASGARMTIEPIARGGPAPLPSEAV
jgi:GTP-binding protein HflX